MDKLSELEKQLDELSLNIEKEKLVLQQQKLSHNTLSHEFDRKSLRDVIPSAVPDEMSVFETLDTKFVRILAGEEIFVTLRQHFEGIKVGKLTLENVTSQSPCRVDVSGTSMRVVLEHIRSGMKLKHIGIPDGLDERLLVLQDVRKIGGLEKLQTRLEVLCFIQSLDNEDSLQKEYRIMQDLEIMKHEFKILRELNEKQAEVNKKLKIDLEEEKDKKSKTVMDLGKPVTLHVGGASFKCYINQMLKPYEFSRLSKMIVEQENSHEPIFIDKDKRMFEKVHSYVYFPSKFLSSTPVSFDEQNLFNEAMEFYLGSDDEDQKLRNPSFLSGEQNLRMMIEEDTIRTMFVKERNHPLLEKEDLLLMSVFDCDKEIFKPVPNDRVDQLPFIFNVEGDPNSFLQPIRENTYIPPIVDTTEDFQRNFKTFTSHLLEGLDFSNLFVAGGSVLANLLDYSVPPKGQVGKKKKVAPGHHHQPPYMRMMMMQQQQEQTKEQEEAEKGRNQFDNALLTFKRKERLTNFSEAKLDPVKSSGFVSLLNVPVSPLLLKRLISLKADVASASGFKTNPEMMYNGFEVPDSMQFLKNLTFRKNKFSFQSPRLGSSENNLTFRFIVGSPSIPEHFKVIPKDIYPIGLSDDQSYLFFTVFSSPFKQDFPVYVLPMDGGEAWDPMPLSSFISHLSPVDEFVDDPEGMTRRHRHFSKSDIDVFVYGTSVEEARKKLRTIYDTIVSNIEKQAGTIRDVLVIRTSYSVTFQFHKRRPIQLVLRLYKSPTEILSGFDIDSCCVGYDGKRVLCLPRFRRALTQRYNLINVERQSTTYELRLYKYARRGFRVAIPGFSPSLVKREGLIQVDLSEKKWKAKEQLFTEPTYLNTCGLSRLLVLQAKMQRKMKSALMVINRSDYDGAYMTIPARLRRANPRFVNALLIEKEQEMRKKIESLVEYAGLKAQSWKSPMIFSLNDIEAILLNTDSEVSQIPRDVEFLTENPGTQEKVTGSFRPVRVNFFSGTYLCYKDLVEQRWKEDLGRYQWWYSHDNGASLATFSPHQSMLMEEARIEGKLNALKTRSVIVDFDEGTCFFVKDREMTKYKIYRLRDYDVPK